MKIRKNNFLFLLLFIMGLFLACLSSFILPEKFFYDTKILVFDKYNEIGLIGSYPFSILFYKVTLLKNLPFFLVALIQYPILIYLLYKIGVPNKFNKITIKNVLIYISFFLIAIYISMPSKEFISYLYFAIIPIIYKSKKSSIKVKSIIVLLFIAFFGVFFRPYYLLMPIIVVGMYVVIFIKIKNKTITSIFYGLLITILLSLSYGFIKGKNLSESSRESLNTERINAKDTNSMIVSPVNVNSWYGESIGIIYGFFSVNIPIEGFKHFLHPQILCFIIWQLLLFYILLVRLSRCIKKREKYDFQLLTLLILFSFFIIQGVFEPDLGSAIRHKIGIFPLIYYVLYYEEFKQQTV